MPLVLAYDIPDDKRRERLRRVLLGFGTPVQYSVFECDLTPRQVQRMRQAVLNVIQLPEDNVRYYQLCRGCLLNVEVFGGVPMTRRRLAYVV
jgi:CRISPR-associated protein Cas2